MYGPCDGHALEGRRGRGSGGGGRGKEGKEGGGEGGELAEDGQHLIPTSGLLPVSLSTWYAPGGGVLFKNKTGIGL
jgi:hypothetical protein